MKPLSLTEISTIIDGKLFPSKDANLIQVSEILSDSRKVFSNKNSLFFALIGPFNNGHKYIGDLEKKGINAFVISDRAAITTNNSFILVDDTTKALQKLASYNRNLYSQIG